MKIYSRNDSEKLKRLLQAIRQEKKFRVAGLRNSRLALILALLEQNLGEVLIILTPDEYRAESLYEDLLRLTGEENIKYLPHQDVYPHEEIPLDRSKEIKRLEVLRDLSRRQEGLYLIPVQSFSRCLSPAWRWQELSQKIELGKNYDLDRLTALLIEAGYSREAMVEFRGQFSLRGGILDVFPPGCSHPYRIEFFGDEVESLRSFTIEDQRSVEECREALLTPARELLLPEDLEARINSIAASLDKNHSRFLSRGEEEAARRIQEKKDKLLSEGREQQNPAVLREYLPFLYNNLASLFDYFPRQVRLLLDDPEKIFQSYRRHLKETGELFSELLEQGEVLSYYFDNFLQPEELESEVYSRHQIEFLSRTGPRTEVDLEFRGQSLEPYHARFDLLADRIRELRRKKLTVLLTFSSENKMIRVTDHLHQELDISKVTELNINQPGIFAGTGTLAEGFILEDFNLAVFTEKEILGRKKRRKRKLEELEQSEKISSFTDLTPGDFVVHENHGIGRYLGIKTLEVQDQQQDYLLLQYADDDKLYVPTDQINLVQKYIGGESQQPRLYRLGGSEWQKVKQRVRSSVKELAINLIELYASRESIAGYSFSEDTVWQQEFEDDFPFEETPDQKQAIAEVKDDMESPHPMDRLLCGDVGYGKTEVAIRAAFKAAMDGKQTAMLVPTTILAQQHFNTFRERLEDYPLKVGMISRFRSPAEQKNIKKQLASGRIDIIIGTHRLFSSDIEFNDLGLLVIDEEQRFGVAHKEKLKNLKKKVDVLTLTATPIPRTLHMALVGVRDMSVIETPPENRYPIRTYVKKFSKETVRDAIRRELARDGQVYYVHNRVEDIDSQAEMVQELVPEARIAIAHGQMRESRLEKIMLNFYDKEYDVLVCTTIIENGLDIANVNSIIINQAEKFGLAQLYQLRGRVGRTNRVAYAYLMYQEDKILPEVAEKRLQAIKEFTSLGSGFKIAMRDMEIRGAGNILGPEQHGHIASVGYSLYCKLLEQAMEELQGEEEEKRVEAEVRLNLDAFIPEDYIPDSSQKIDIYQRIMAAGSDHKLADIKAELEDRFGDLPEEVANLLFISRVKLRASQLKITEVKEEQDRISCFFQDKQSIDSEAVMKLAREYSREIKIRSAQQPVISVRKSGIKKKKELLLAVLDSLLEFVSWPAELESGKVGDEVGS